MPKSFTSRGAIAEDVPTKHRHMARRTRLAAMPAPGALAVV